ncbi:MAG: HAD family hydrolase [Candidatus Nanopelagicales bacterium]
MSSGSTAQMPRLVATDLDGTVVRSDGTISARVVAALNAVEDAGIDLVVVTGRPPRWMRAVVEATGHRGLAICANGALVYDLQEEQVMFVDALPPSSVPAIIERVRGVLPGAAFALETTGGFVHEVGYEPRWDIGTRRVEGDLLGSLPAGAQIVKLLVRDEISRGDAMLAMVAPLLGGLAEATHSNPADCLLEISALGISKATTLARLCASRGITARQVVAFGDQPNDLAMLRWAGRAYAMGNAHPDVLAAIPRRTGTVDEDGVAVVLERLLAKLSDAARHA